MVTVPSTIRDTDGLDGVSITQSGNNFATTVTSALTVLIHQPEERSRRE